MVNNFFWLFELFYQGRTRIIKKKNYGVLSYETKHNNQLFFFFLNGIEAKQKRKSDKEKDKALKHLG